MPAPVKVLEAVETARVKPLPTVNVPVEEVIVNPFTVLLVKAWAESVPTKVVVAVGRVKTVESVPLKVMVLFTVKVLPLAMLSVPVVAPTCSPLMEMACPAVLVIPLSVK